VIDIILIGLPGLVALIVCIKRSPQYAFLNVYLPVLLLLPQTYNWNISGQLCFADTAILPIATMMSYRCWRSWKWNAMDVLVLAYVAVTVLSEGINKGYKLGQNLALQDTCAIILPYFAMVQTLRQGKDAVVAFAKRVGVALVVIAVLSIYEFRMGVNLFTTLMDRFFPAQPNTVVFRSGFMRIQGPYGHAISAGAMMAIGFRIMRWLEWNGEWTESLGFLPLSKVRFCQIWIALGSLMTISVGPWLGAAVGAIAVWLCRARNRMQAILLLTLAVVLVGPPMYSSFENYVSVDPTVARFSGDRLQEDSAYRHKLLPAYIPVIEERMAWGWGRNEFPVIDGMASIDNGYLLVALTFGSYALLLQMALLIVPTLQLALRSLPFNREDTEATTAFTLIGIYTLLGLTLGTVWLGAAAGRFIFIINAWSSAWLKDCEIPAVSESRAPLEIPNQCRFRRIMS